MQRMAKTGRFSYDAAVRRHIDGNIWETEEDERLESETPWEAAFEYGEELALEEQAADKASEAEDDWY